MTGEITLRGKILPIGGLKEKSMAAYSSGIKTVFIPKDNLPNLEEVDQVVKDTVEFVPVEYFTEVLDRAIIKPITTKEIDDNMFIADSKTQQASSVRQ